MIFRDGRRVSDFCSCNKGCNRSQCSSVHSPFLMHPIYKEAEQEMFHFVEKSSNLLHSFTV